MTNATDPVRAILAQLRHEVEQDKGGYYTNYERGRLEEKRRSIQLLEAALAQQPAAPAQEAVAWVPPSFFADGTVAATARRNPPSDKAVELRGEYVPLYRAPQPAIPEGWSFVRQDDGSIVARAEGYGAACVREGDNTSVAAGLLYLLAADLLAARPTQDPDHG